jgi:hypothetical protein
LLITSIIFFIRYRKKKLSSLNNNTQLDVVWVSSDKLTEIFVPTDKTLDDFQNCEIFKIGNTDIIDSEITSSSTLQNNLIKSL